MTKLFDMKYVSAAVVLAVCLNIPASLMAAPHKNGQSNVTVTMSDLNLSSMEGNRALYQRLVTAANEVCGKDQFYVTRNISVLMYAEQCIDETVDNAVETINNPILTALHKK